jgi:hypothetical protein
MPPARRRARRHRLRLKVSTGRGSSFTVNVGTGGYCTEVMRVYPVGDSVEGFIQTPRGKTSYRGRVAWSIPGDATVGLRGRMGVCFVQVDQAFDEDLRASREGDGPAAAAPRARAWALGGMDLARRVGARCP